MTLRRMPARATVPECAAALAGKTVVTVEGVSVFAVPRGDASQGMVATDHARVEGSDVNATSELSCATVRGTEGFSAGSPEVSGSAACSLKAERGNNETRIGFRPERNVVADVFVGGDWRRRPRGSV